MADQQRPRRPRGDGALYQDAATDRWIAVVDLGRGADGRRRRRKVTGQTKTEVTKRMRALRAQLAKGIEIGRRCPTVAELVDEWLCEGAPGPGGPKSEATLARLRPRLRLHLVKHLGSRGVDELTVRDVDRWLQAEADRGQSRRTIQDYRSDLRQLLTEAERLDLVTKNVAQRSRVPQRARISAPKRSLSRADVAALTAGLADDRLGPYFTLLVELGLRPQEADALAWEDIDLEANVITIHRAMQRNDGGGPLGIGRPKTAGSARRLRLTEAAATALRARKAEQATERLQAGFVWSQDERWADLAFTSEVGTPMHPSNVRRSFAAACRRAGIEPVSVYELRHTVASLLVDAGASPYQVADQLGHTTTRMLDRHYRHRIADVVDTAAVVAERRTAER